jgi:signal transduction histidine kinase
MLTPPLPTLLVIPTGVGCAVGGFAGDGLPAARLLAAASGCLVTHPNVMNGAALYWSDRRIHYVEGWALDRFAAGELALAPVAGRRLGLLLDAGIEPELRQRQLQAAEACRASLGLAIGPVVTTEASLGVGLSLGPSGASWGTLARPDAAWDAETARQSLQVIEEEADRLEALINNLLDVSRIQASGLRLDYADVNLERLARKVVEAYRTQTTEHQLEVDFPAALPLVWGDEERLRQVLTNLVSNAIKYSPQGGLIRIGGWLEQPEGAADHTRVVLYIADQGIGIPTADLPKIFDRFYRVDSSLRRSTAGAGLGLYLAKAIVEAHGGQIWAHSEAGKGTTFFIGLLVEQGHQEATVGAVRQ